MENNSKIPSRSMESRINLQYIGSSIMNGDDTLIKIDDTPFKERENHAYQEMEKSLHEIIGEDKSTALIEEIMIYTDTTFQIKFSQGLKVGATLQLKLISNFGSDV